MPAMGSSLYKEQTPHGPHGVTAELSSPEEGDAQGGERTPRVPFQSQKVGPRSPLPTYITNGWRTRKPEGGVEAGWWVIHRHHCGTKPV